MNSHQSNSEEPKRSTVLVNEMKVAIKLTQDDLEEALSFLDSASEKLRHTTIILNNASDLDED